MTSPLLPYANAYLVVVQRGAPEIVDGRVTTTAGSIYLVECYLKRQDSTGTNTGADYLPTQLNPGSALPGASGEVYLYRGYALRQAIAPNGYNPVNDALPSGLAWREVSNGLLTPGLDCVHLQGGEPPKPCRVERNTGRYGGAKIDEIVASSIGGVPIIVRSGDFTG